MSPAALALLVLAAAGPLKVEAHLDRARELVRELRYEPALVELDAARGLPAVPVPEQVAIELETGIAQFDLLHVDAARRAFRAALKLDPRAALPENLSPRIVDVWEEVRTELGLPAMAPGSPANSTPSPVPAAGGASAPDVPPSAAPPSGLAPAASPALAAVHASPPAPARSTLTAVGPFALLGAGAAVGIVGGAFGLRARADHAQAGSATVQLEVVDANAAAHGHATAANVLFATAGALAVAGIVWLLAR